MLNAFAIIIAVCGTILFVLSVIMLIRKGKPFKTKFNEKSQEPGFPKYFFVFLLIQSIIAILYAVAIYLTFTGLFVVLGVISLPILIYWIVILFKKKEKN